MLPTPTFRTLTTAAAAGNDDVDDDDDDDDDVNRIFAHCVSKNKALDLGL